VSCYLTQDISKREVEFRVECFAGLPAVLNATLDPLNFAARMDLGADVAPLGYTGTFGPNPQPPESSGTRGTYLGHLVSQALSGSCSVPADMSNVDCLDAADVPFE
jgi:hypothetical protein